VSEVLEQSNDSWPEVVVSDVSELIRGVTYSKEHATDKPQDGYTPVLRATNIQESRLVLESDLVFVPDSNVSANQRLRAGDIVVATSSGSKHLVGKSGLVHADWRGSFGAFCAAIRPKANIESRYLAAFLQSPSYWKQVGKKALGVNINNLRRGDIESLTLPWPPLAKQREIVAELEKQFSRLDEAVANLQRVKANLKRYKASVLKAAVEGRLVETEATLARREGRTYETGEQLLQRILEGRPSAWKGKYDSPTPPECPDDAVTPDGWTWITVSQAMRERIVNGLSIKESATPTSVRALKLSAMSDQGLDFDDFRWLPIELSKVEDIVIRESDFFVSRGNGSLELVGRGSPAQGPKQAVIFPDTMMRIRFSQVVNVGPWFHALWTTRLVRTQIEKRVKTTAGIYKMAQPELASITVPLPPLAEQARIVAEVDRHLSIIREVEAEVDANLQRAQALRQATLAKAFTSSSQSKSTV
jgi:type I restriction enzyme S subunit